MSITAFGAKIFSADVITKPETPPNTISDSRIIASLNFWLIENYLDNLPAFSDSLIEL